MWWKKVKMWIVAGVAATAGAVGGLNWDKVKSKLEETGVKTHCEGHIQADACSIDQRCRWDFDTKKCGDKK